MSHTEQAGKTRKKKTNWCRISVVQEHTELLCWLGSGVPGSPSGTDTFWRVSPAAYGGYGQLSVFPENSNRKWSAAILGATQIA